MLEDISIYNDGKQAIQESCTQYQEKAGNILKFTLKKMKTEATAHIIDSWIVSLIGGTITFIT